ncbi:glycosyltransferase [Iodobacter sp. HSC-16F04]|uniref:Glycosyltransferase n=1 Tax=Iodobacter violaceini TaxID=3044271 RepID=A0ABX0KUD8_9NEIS|nr:glycosyltransferase family 2 protein [Iodobacter violacea]NHQ85980.1 glycosyltransferase [Iodobacter violacea]
MVNNKEQPLVSVITVVYNDEANIEKTMKCIKNQTYKNIEYIVIDGGSKDRTVELIRKNEALVSYWVSEPDNGIGDAWNKGVAKASGDYICILNCGDLYESAFIEKNVSNLRRDQLDILYGKTYLTANNKVSYIVDDVFNESDIVNGFHFMHTSCFTTKAVYDLVGCFDQNISIAVDTDWLLRALKLKVNFMKVNTENYMELGGVSDRKWKEASLQYLSCLVRHGFIKESELTLNKLLITVKNIYRVSGLVSLKRKIKNLI